MQRLLFTIVCLFLAILTPQLRSETPPNIVIIFLDDSGYGDFSAFNEGLAYATPNVDQLASEGCRYLNFYIPQAICSASRASLLTGRYPENVGASGAFSPRARGLKPEHKILPEYLKQAGYTSALIGKWHLGDTPDTRPHARGFDYTSGLMYSNDMWKHHPTDPEHWGKYPLSYWQNGDIVDAEVDEHDQKQLTKRYTEEAVDFIQHNAQRPFFLYLAHSMPHVPLFCSEAFEGKSGAGLYGDVIMELDWSVGQVNQAIKQAGIEENTIVVFTSDNGPWLVYGNHAGQTPFREGKRSSFDGGTRSACIVKYPQSIKAASVSQKAFCSIDLVPTFLKLAGVSDAESRFDGKDLWPLISGQAGSTNPHAYYAFTIKGTLEAIMRADGRWKLHLEHRHLDVISEGGNGLSGKETFITQPPALYDLLNDPEETDSLLLSYPETAKKLNEFAKEHLERIPSLSGKLLPY